MLFIRNRAIADTFRVHFDAIWEQGTPVPDDVLSPEDLFPAALDPERLWRIAGVATLIGLAIYEDAERFIAPAAEAS